MKKITNNIVNIFSGFGIFIYVYLTFIGTNRFIYDFNYTKAIIYIVLISLVVFTGGVFKNDSKTYKINKIIYIILYILLLIGLTFFISRDTFRFYNWWYTGNYKPFKEIMNQIKYGSTVSIVKNIVGNLIMMIPLSLLLIIKNKKLESIIRQSIILLPIIVGIEVVQATTHTGAFDIDDIIMNYISSILFVVIVTRIHITDLIRNIFETDFKLNKVVKYIFLVISISMLTLYTLTILFKLQ